MTDMDTGTWKDIAWVLSIALTISLAAHAFRGSK